MNDTSQESTWASIRYQIVKKRLEFLSDEPVFLPHSSLYGQFPDLRDVPVLEQEQIVTKDLLSVLCGVTSENIRAVVEENKKFRLNVNPSLDPYLKGSIERFTDNIGYLFYIRKCNSVSQTKFYSRMTCSLLHEITSRVDDLVYAVVGETENVENNILNKLCMKMGDIHDYLKTYKNIVQTVFENNLIGGQVLDVLDNEIEEAYDSILSELTQLRELSWRCFTSMLGTWISKGILEDPSLEFFIWPSRDVSSMDIKRLTSRLPDNLRYLEKIVIVQELCPMRLRNMIDDIVQCGLQKADSLKRGKEFYWTEMNEYEFRRTVESLSNELAAESLQKLKLENSLDESLAQLHSFLLLQPCCGWLIQTLINKQMLDRSYDSITKTELKDFNAKFQSTFANKLPIVRKIRFEAGRKNIFDSLRMKTNKYDASHEERRDDKPSFYDMIELDFDINEFSTIITEEALGVFSLMFKVLSRLEVGAHRLHSSRQCLDMDLRQTSMIDASNDRDVRLQLYLLKHLENSLFDFRNKIVTGISSAFSVFSKNYTKATTIHEVKKLEEDLSIDIIAKTDFHHLPRIDALEDLLMLIDSVDKYAFDQVQEQYNLWRESMDGLACAQ